MTGLENHSRPVIFIALHKKEPPADAAAQAGGILESFRNVLYNSPLPV